MIKKIATTLFASAAAATIAVADDLLIDDMSTDRASHNNARWQWSTDRVMGGRSTGQAGYVNAQGGRGIQMTGSVSTENNGGFLKVGLPFRPRLDADAYAGIELRVKGNRESYAIHLRDRQSTFPWQVFSASYQTNGDWQTVQVPFADFRPYQKRSKAVLDPGSISEIGLIAGNYEYEAELVVSEVRLYR